MADHLAALWPHVDVQTGEERLVQDRADDFAACGVGRLRVVQQFQRPVKHLAAGFKLSFGLLQLTADAALFGADALDLLAELVLGPVFLCPQVEEVAFFLVELGQLVVELVAYLSAQAVAGF